MNILPLRVAETPPSNSIISASALPGNRQRPLLPWQYAETSKLSYASSWIERGNANGEAQGGGATVFGLTFNDCYLIGCTSKGEVLFWKLKHHDGNGNDSRLGLDQESLGQELTLRPSIPWSIQDDSMLADNIAAFDGSTQVDSASYRPILRLRLDPHGTNEASGYVESDIILYHCQITERSTGASTKLIVSGKNGIYVIDWDADILPLLCNENRRKTDVSEMLPYRHYRSHPIMPPITQWRGKCGMPVKDHRLTLPCFAEINCVVVDGNFMYGASGDDFGCYKWDLASGQIVATFNHTHCMPKPRGVARRSSRKNYLHSVEIVPGTMLLLTGGEDGILGIWNKDANQLVTILNLNPAVHECLVSREAHGQRRGSSTDDVCWISCCLARDELWWIVAGGLHVRDESCGGFIATIHGPTRSIRSIALTPGIIQSVALYPACACLQQLVAVSNTHHVLYWENIFQLHDGPSQSVWCHAPSIFALATERRSAQRSPRLALGGVGSVVDILEDGNRYSQLLHTD